MAFTDTIFQWLGFARTVTPLTLPTNADGAASELTGDVRGRLLVALGDAGDLACASYSQTITASDTTTYGGLTPPVRGIMVLTTGLVSLVLYDPRNTGLGPAPTTTLLLSAGVVYPFFVYAVRATGTDAALLVAGQIVLLR